MIGMLISILGFYCLVMFMLGYLIASIVTPFFSNNQKNHNTIKYISALITSFIGFLLFFNMDRISNDFLYKYLFRGLPIMTFNLFIIRWIIGDQKGAELRGNFLTLTIILVLIAIVVTYLFVNTYLNN